jgi:hypothetical protein
MAPLTIQHYVHVARRPAFRRFWLGMMISRAGDAFPLGSAIGGALIGVVGIPVINPAVGGTYLALATLPLLAHPGARPRQNAE